MKKLVIGGIVGGIVLFLLGYLFYGKLFEGFLHSVAHPRAKGIERPMEQLYWPGLIVGNILDGFLLSYVLNSLGKVSSAAKGFFTGGVIGFLVAGAIDCIMYATANIITIKGLMADVAIFSVMCAITGAIVVVVSNMGNKST